LLKNTALRTLDLGTKVEAPAAVLPATATANIFTVAGGRVAITGLVGVCTTVCSATATTLALGTAPTVGTANTTGLTSATAITSKEAGTMVSLPPAVGSGLVVGTNAGVAAQLSGQGACVVSAGTITITTSATNTGAFRWTLTYIPFDDGASVAAS
jgi:hypothetical protein